MRICVVHNEYGKTSGEEVMVGKIRDMLLEAGHEVIPFTKSSAAIPNMRFGRLRALLCGIHSPRVLREFGRLLDERKPDVALFQNVYPFISTGAFPVAKKRGIPVIFRCGNYRIFCPTGLLLSHGELCERCVGGREYWCVWRNCMGSFPKSLGYALRNTWARISGNIVENVDQYVTQTAFTKNKFVEWGLPEDRITVIPNFVEATGSRPEGAGEGQIVGFAGRISPEKDVPTLLEAFRSLPDLELELAGGYDAIPDLPAQAPGNAKFLGFLDAARLEEFYSRCRFVVVPSKCYEVFPVVLVESMLRGRPAVCARIGGLPEIVEDGKTGLLFEPGNVEDLTAKIRRLWDRPELCRQMGEAARAKATTVYTKERFYESLMGVFTKAIESASRPAEPIDSSPTREDRDNRA